MLYGNHEISIKMAVLGVATYFLILLIATAIDIVVWRKLTTEFSNWLNIITMIVLNVVFFKTLENRSGFEIRIFRNTSFNGIILALLVSAILFALLHFNMIQTLSALICGLVLGILYIFTGSLFICILAHALYNAISYFTTIYSIY